MRYYYILCAFWVTYLLIRGGSWVIDWQQNRAGDKKWAAKVKKEAECEHVWAIPDDKNFAWCKLCAKKGERVVPQGVDADMADLLRQSFRLTHPEPEVEKPEPEETVPEGFGPPKKPEPKRIKGDPKNCQHDWFTPFNSSETKCTRCGKTKAEDASKCSHTYTLMTAKEFQPGKFKNVIKCADCGQELLPSKLPVPCQHINTVITPRVLLSGDMQNVTKCGDCGLALKVSVSPGLPPVKSYNVIQNASINGGSITQSAGDLYVQNARIKGELDHKIKEITEDLDKHLKGL